MDRKTTPKPVIDQATREMGGALKNVYEAAKQLLREATHTEALNRYRVGAIVNQVRKDPARYGDAAVALLSTALALDATTLYRYARVAEAWDELDFVEVIGYRMPNGSPLSWSHLLEISAVQKSKDRDRLVQDAVTNGLSVRDVIALIRNIDSTPPSSARSDSISDRLRWFVDFSNALERGIQATEKAIKRLEATPETLRTLGDARAARERLRDLLQRYDLTLDAVEQRLQAESEADMEIDSQTPTRVKKGLGKLLYGMDLSPKSTKGKPS